MKRVILGLALLSAVLSPVAAWSQAIDYRAIIAEGQTGTVFFDQQRENTLGTQYPLHFSITMPISPGTVDIREDPNLHAGYVMIIYGTMDGQIAERVRIYPQDMPQGTVEEGLANLQRTISRGIDNPPSADSERIDQGTRTSMVGGYPASEGFFVFSSPTIGNTIMRVVVVLPPSGDQALLFITETTVEIVPIQSPDDLSETFVGTLIESIQFTAWRDETGVLIPF